jgi:hypothetical protein
MNDDRACVCGRRDLSEVVECARCRTLLAQCNCPKGWLENRALWVAAERRALAAEAELTAARETVARYREERDTAIRVLVAARRECDAMKPVVDAAEAWVKGDWATARHKREELTRAIDTFRSTSKPQEPTSE